MTRRKYGSHEEAAEANRILAAQKSRLKSQALREIGPLPPPENPERKESCRYNLEKFLVTYFPGLFPHPFSEAHRRYLRNLENGILHDESSVCLLPRGFGKSTIACCACLWSLFYNHKCYILLVASSASNAKKLLGNIKSELMFNEQLGPPVLSDTKPEDYPTKGDFPEVVVPLRRIGSAAQRQGGQTLGGEPTRCQISAERIVLPTVTGSEASGAVLECAGFGANIRGKNISTSRGSLRPDAVVCDDIQSDKGAQNESRIDEQEDLLNSCIKGLASVGSSLTVICALTTIREGDLAERLHKNPVWRSTRFGVVDRLPGESAMEEWGKLNQLRAELIEEGLNDGEVAERLNVEFLKNKDKLIDDCRVTWDAFRDKYDVHPMQKIMRLYFDDPIAFSREYLNNPGLLSVKDGTQLTTPQLESKVCNYPRNAIPLEAEYLVCGCDSQTVGIYYSVLAVAADGSAWVVDYAKFPKAQKSTITKKYGGVPLEQAIYQGYSELAKDLLSRTYVRPDGLELSISRMLVDASHGPTNSKILQFIRDFGDSRITPIYGRSKSPDELIFSKKKPGELRGRGWSMPPVRRVKDATGKMISLPRYAILDVSSWKSALRSGLQANQGTPGSICIFKDALENHREYFLHLTSEKSSVLTGKFGSVDSWKLQPNRLNHYWDTLVYAYAASSMVQKFGGGNHNMKPEIEQQFRKRVKLSDIQKQRGSY